MRIASQAGQLESKLRDWLKSQGYPLELRTARAFQEAGHVKQSNYYYDTESDCYREIDVHVSLQSLPDDDADWIELALCIEVKSANDKPWVLFSGREKPPLLPISAAYQRIASPAAKEWMRSWAFRRKIRDMPLLELEDYSGHSLIRANLAPNQREDVAYKAILSAVKAARWEAQRAGETDEESILLAFPVVVIDAPLFKCTLDDNSDDLRLWRVDWGTLVWRNAVTRGEGTHTIVHVVTESALKEYADKAVQTIGTLSEVRKKYPIRKGEQTEG